MYIVPLNKKELSRSAPYQCDFCHEKARKKKYKINKSNCESKMFCSLACKEAYIEKYKIQHLMKKTEFSSVLNS